MKIFFLTTLAVFSVLAAAVETSLALETVDSMRCGSKLVQLGDNKVDILSKCGEPALRQKITRGTSAKKAKGKPAAPVQYREDDQWTYDFGPRDFLYTLTFDGGELKSIGRGGRGTRR